MWLLDKMLRTVIQTGELIVTAPDGKVHRYGTPDPARPAVKARFTDAAAIRYLERDPRNHVGELWMDGRLLVEQGDIRDLIMLLRQNAPWERQDAIGARNPVRKVLDFLSGRLDQINWRGRSARNAEHAYNLTRQLYELFLDEDRQYTCAYYRDPTNSLEQAQLDKKAHIAAKLNLKPGMRVLDIGCGWGGLALYLHRHYDVDVVGVALAPDQIAFCQERAAAEGVADRVTFELKDYRDVEGQFDRIVSVGLIEHLGRPSHPGFFAKCAELLKPDGVMFSHCCGRMGGRGITDKWTRKYIFPGGYTPSLSELVDQAEKHKFLVTDVETLRFHYAHTLEEWYRRTVAHRDEIVAMYDERFYRMWLFYLAGAEAAFRYGSFVNWQIQYVRRRDALPIVRDAMSAEEVRLRETEQAPHWHLAAE